MKITLLFLLIGTIAALSGFAAVPPADTNTHAPTSA